MEIASASISLRSHTEEAINRLLNSNDCCVLLDQNSVVTWSESFQSELGGYADLFLHLLCLEEFWKQVQDCFRLNKEITRFWAQKSAGNNGKLVRNLCKFTYFQIVTRLEPYGKFLRCSFLLEETLLLSNALLQKVDAQPLHKTVESFGWAHV